MLPEGALEQTPDLTFAPPLPLPLAPIPLALAMTEHHARARGSRLPVHFENEAKPFRRFCKPRNEHSYECDATPC